MYLAKFILKPNWVFPVHVSQFKFKMTVSEIVLFFSIFKQTKADLKKDIKPKIEEKENTNPTDVASLENEVAKQVRCNLIKNTQLLMKAFCLAIVHGLYPEISNFPSRSFNLLRLNETYQGIDNSLQIFPSPNMPRNKLSKLAQIGQFLGILPRCTIIHSIFSEIRNFHNVLFCTLFVQALKKALKSQNVMLLSTLLITDVELLQLLQYVMQGCVMEGVCDAKMYVMQRCV